MSYVLGRLGDAALDDMVNAQRAVIGLPPLPPGGAGMTDAEAAAALAAKTKEKYLNLGLGAAAFFGLVYVLTK